MWVGLFEHFLHRADLVDHHAEDRADGALAWKATVFGEPHLAAQQINQVFRVASVEHGEVALNACRLRKLTQDGMSQAVKCAARNALAARIGQRSRVREHACRRTPREGEQQDGLWPRSRLYQTRHTINEGARLSSA